MKKATLIVLVCGLLFSFTFSEKSTVPDPEAFGKKVVKTIATGDSTLYMKAFGVDSLLIQSLIDSYLTHPYRNKNQDEIVKMQFTKYKGEIMAEISVQVENSIQIIELWKKKEQIDVSKLQYVTTYYGLEFAPSQPVVVLSKAGVLTKYDTTYYLFNYREAAFLNSEWRTGILKNITKLGNNIEEELMSYSYKDVISIPYDVDSTAISAADTTISYSETVVPTEAVDPSKKQKKINKKIDKLQEKIEKLRKEN